jgi:hypothetical protein
MINLNQTNRLPSLAAFTTRPPIRDLYWNNQSYKHSWMIGDRGVRATCLIVFLGLDETPVSA